MIEQKTGDRLLQVAVWLFYAFPFLQVYGHGLIHFVQEWKELIGSALGAGIGAVGAFYIGRDSVLESRRIAQREHHIDQLRQNIAELTAMGANIEHHRVLVEKLIRQITDAIEALGGQDKDQIKTFADQEASIRRFALLKKIIVPEVLDSARSDFDRTGYGQMVVELGHLTDAIGLLHIRQYESIETLKTAYRADIIQFYPLAHSAAVRALDAANSLNRQYGKKLVRWMLHKGAAKTNLTHLLNEGDG